MLWGAGKTLTILQALQPAVGAAFPVIQVQLPADQHATIKHLTITGGAQEGDEAGAGIRHLSGHLLVARVIIEGNHGDDGGGGIYNAAFMRIVDAIIRDNWALI
jgi:hypothetical protein